MRTILDKGSSAKRFEWVQLTWKEAMAKAGNQIDLYLAALEEAIKAITEEFFKTYSDYLTALGKAVRQQLIMASYQICTQGYPESFLGLSFNKRQELQQALRQLTAQAKKGLVSQLDSLKQPQETTDTNPTPTNPETLLKWQEQLEQGILQILQTLSREANRLLQQADILPRKLPEVVLEAATKAEVAHPEPVPGPPNLLNLLIESEPSEDTTEEGQKPSSKVTHIIAINLRLSDIEFADATVMAGRNQIRNLSTRLNTLKREFQKKQRERLITEAEAAWRSSWFED